MNQIEIMVRCFSRRCGNVWTVTGEDAKHQPMCPKCFMPGFAQSVTGRR